MPTADWDDFAVAAVRSDRIIAAMRERLMPEMTAEDEGRIRAFLAGGGTFLTIGRRAFMREDLEGLAQ